MAGIETKPTSTGSAGGDVPYHLDPSKPQVEAVIDDFNHHQFKAGVQSFETLQQADLARGSDAWQRHLNVINGSVNLGVLGIADAGDMLGVDPSGHLLTSNGAGNEQQVRSADDLAVQDHQSLCPVFQRVRNGIDTYKGRMSDAKQMLANPQPKGNSANEVHTIIADFNEGRIREGAQAMRTLQQEDSKVEPEMWVRHNAAINANIDLHKMGIQNASQILTVDDNGKLVTASADLKTEQIRSLDNPGSVEAEKYLEPTPSRIDSQRRGDSALYAQAKQVADLLQEAEEAKGPLGPGDHRLSFTSANGEQREVLAHVPLNPTGKPMPVYYLLHMASLGDGIPSMELETKMNERADKQGFIAIYPIAEVHENEVNSWWLLGGNFQYRSWNSRGAGMNVTYGYYDDIDDYLKPLAAMMDNKLNIDPNARYILAMSEGGEFAPQVVARMPGYWAGMGIWHGTSLGTEQMPVGDPVAYAQILGRRDVTIPEVGGGGIFGFLYHRLAASEPTEEFDRMAQAEGCHGTPSQDFSNPAQVVTTFAADKCSMHRPVINVDRVKGEHAVDGDGGNWFTWAIGTITGHRDTSWDSTQYLIDTLSQYRKNS